MKYLTFRLLLSIELWELWVDALGRAANEWGLGFWCLGQDMAVLEFQQHRVSFLHSASPLAPVPFVLGSQNTENEEGKTSCQKTNHTFSPTAMLKLHRAVHCPASPKLPGCVKIMPHTEYLRQKPWTSHLFHRSWENNEEGGRKQELAVLYYAFAFCGLQMLFTALLTWNMSRPLVPKVPL